VIPIEAIGPGTEGDDAWAAGELLVLLRRAAPEEIPKRELQESSGIGASDMRQAIAVLEERGQVLTTDTGYRLAEGDEDDDADSSGALGQILEDSREDAEPGEEDADDDPPGYSVGEPEDAEPSAAEEQAAEEVAEAAGVPQGGAPLRYHATLAVEIGFYPKLKPGEDPHEAAKRDAEEMGAALRAFAEQRWPGVSVGGYTGGIEVFQRLGQLS
jgi:hypothetical protein